MPLLPSELRRQLNTIWGWLMSKLFLILFGLLPSCNQLMGSGALEVGMSLPVSTSERHEPGGFILSYCPSLSLSSLLCVIGKALAWQGTLQQEIFGKLLAFAPGRRHALPGLMCFQPLQWRVGGDRPGGGTLLVCRQLFQMQFPVAFGWFCS